MKSILLPVAIHEDIIDPKEATEASLLEMLIQSSQWGQMPEVHTLGKADMLKHVAMANILMRSDVQY